jgi:hypothetical protein
MRAIQITQLGNPRPILGDPTAPSAEEHSGTGPEG